MKDKIYLCLAHMGGQELKFVQEAFYTNWVTPLGPNVDAFENDLETFLKEKKFVAAVSSGTAAIHIALTLLDIGVGDEVICQSFTFAASANPIVYLGATPVFVDSEEDTWNMSPELLEQAIKDRIAKTGKKPKAIVIVHLYGMPAMMDEIMKIARHYDIPVVEDAAEAMGSMYDSHLCGTIGDYGILSFNGNKMITTSGGGALVCPTKEKKSRAIFYATQAREKMPFYQHEHIGYNYRLSNVCAGIGRGQMIIVEDHIAHHRHVAALYEELLSDVDGIKVHIPRDSRCKSNYWLTTITINPKISLADNETIRINLENQNIESRPLWKPLHLQPVFKNVPCYLNGISEQIFNIGLCLPSGPCVSDEDVELIVKEIKRCITK